MTERMRTALQDAAKSPLRRVHDQAHGKPRWPANPGTLAALRRRGFVTYTELSSRQGNRVQLWTITDVGKEALRPPRFVGSERPVFMARGSGTTSERAMAIDDAEVMGAPSEAWLRVARERQMAAKDRRAVGRQLAKELRAA